MIFFRTFAASKKIFFRMANYPDSIDKITKARLRLSAFGSVFSIALTFGVSLLVGVLVARKNRKIDMVEALKGAE